MIHTNYRTLRGAYPGVGDPDLLVSLASGYLVYGYATESTDPPLEPPPDPEPAFADPVFALIDTDITNDLSADGFTWDQAIPFVRDTYGNIIMSAQAVNGGSTRTLFIWRDTVGVWHDNEMINDNGNIGEISTRIGFVYDSVNDCLHGYLYYNGDVTVYRKYEIIRDDDPADILGISWVRDSDPNTVLIESVTDFEHPVTFKFDNRIIVFASSRTGTHAQIIAQRCNIGSDIEAGATVGNWVHLGFSSSDGIGTVDTPSYSTIVTQAANTGLGLGAGMHEDGSIIVAYIRAGSYRYKRLTYSAGAYTLGNEQTIGPVAVSGTDTGYTLKYQLISKVVYIDSDAYLAIAVWRSNVLGDTVRLVRITDSDLVTVEDVYSSNGAHSYVPTFSIEVVDDRIVVTYLKTNDGGTFVRAYDPELFPTTEEFELTTIAESDIPLVTGPIDDNGTMLVVFREVGTPPKPGYFGTFTYA